MNTPPLAYWLAFSLATASAHAADGPTPDQLLLKDFKPRSIYNVPVTRLSRARFPVVDMHSHDYARTDAQIAEWVRTAPDEALEDRYQEGLIEFDQALAASRV